MQPALIINSVTGLGEFGRNRVIIGGSHGGIYPAYLAAKAGVRAAILNDAGVGRDRAGIEGLGYLASLGIEGLGYLASLGIPAATVGCGTARIGDGQDCATRGVISHVNGIAAELGCRPGQTAVEAAHLLAKAPKRSADPPAADESRHRIDGPWNGRINVWALDSVSLARPSDAGAIIATGSHGGLLGGDPATALTVDAFAALYNDATGGIDGAGFTRLPVLDKRGIAAGTVDAMRARIGDGRSTFEDGVITHVNETAAIFGAKCGMTARAFVEMLIKAKPGRT